MAVSTNEAFDYGFVSLQQDVHQFRLLSVYDEDSEDQPLRCKLEVFEQVSPPPYIALSYVWGESTAEHLLTCNESGVVAITHNLHEALKRIRHLQHQRKFPFVDVKDGSTINYVWIDAICINQKDLEERRTQVLMMRRIYEQASKTIIWLGKVDSQALSLIETLDSARQRYEAAKDTRNFSSMSFQERSNYGLPTQYSDWSTFERLDACLSSGWFSRIWVVQELSVSRQPLMMAEASDFELSWDDFAATMNFSHQLSMPMWVLNETQSHALTIIQPLVQGKDNIPLLSLLVRTSKMSATDPRDKVYAILGISSGVGSDIQPDYTVSVGQLFKEVARRLLVSLNEEGYLDVLSVPRLPDEPLKSSVGVATSSPRLPTWVPNWYDKINTTQQAFFPSIFAWMPLDFATWTGSFSWFQNLAAAPKVGRAGDDTNPSIEGNTLRLRGFQLSEIEKIGPQHVFIERASGFMAKMQAVGDEAAVWKSDARLCHVGSLFEKQYPHTGEKMRDVWWQTICAGQNMVDYAETKAGFEKWYTHVHKPSRLIAAPSHPRLVIMNIYWANWVTSAGKKMPALRASSDYRHFNIAATASTAGRRMFRTGDQSIGLGPSDMKKGDVVFLIKGCRTPMVLRRTVQPGQWTLVGPCYLHGFMNGDRYKEELCGDIRLV